MISSCGALLFWSLAGMLLGHALRHRSTSGDDCQLGKWRAIVVAGPTGPHHPNRPALPCPAAPRSKNRTKVLAQVVPIPSIIS
jgi:hypothetical protein